MTLKTKTKQKQKWEVVFQWSGRWPLAFREKRQWRDAILKTTQTLRKANWSTTKARMDPFPQPQVDPPRAGPASEDPQQTQRC